MNVTLHNIENNLKSFCCINIQRSLESANAERWDKRRKKKNTFKLNLKKYLESFYNLLKYMII